MPAKIESSAMLYRFILTQFPDAKPLRNFAGIALTPQGLRGCFAEKRLVAQRKAAPVKKAPIHGYVRYLPWQTTGAQQVTAGAVEAKHHKDSVKRHLRETLAGCPEVEGRDTKIARQRSHRMGHIRRVENPIAYLSIDYFGLRYVRRLANKAFLEKQLKTIRNEVREHVIEVSARAGMRLLARASKQRQQPVCKKCRIL